MELVNSDSTNSGNNSYNGSDQSGSSKTCSNRYESQKRRDWNTFCQYLTNHRPPISPSMCNASHVLEFLHYLDQFGKTKVHIPNCPFFGMPNPPSPCPCPLRQAWGSLDAHIGRLRAAFDQENVNNGHATNPFGDGSIRFYLRDVRDFQSKSRGVSYHKKRKRPNKHNVTATDPPEASS